MFCKGERASIDLLLKAFNYFSKATGLVMNSGKSNFYTNGVPASLVRRLSGVLWNEEKCGPFVYLGVYVTPKRLSIMDCNCLIENVVAKIRALGSRKLSYAGRVVLIQSVLSTLHCYWARIFILPKTVIDAIEKICRQYLWYGKDPKENPALVAWEKICRPKKQGGLVYIKSANWMDYEPHSGASWAWRKICQVKNKLKLLLSTGEPYTIQKGYFFLKPLTDKVAWFPWILNNWICPKHSFFCWLVAQNRLLTQDRLVRMGILDTNCCEVCGVMAEDHNHLFFGCAFSAKCFVLVQLWCNVLVPAQDCFQWWIKWRISSATKKKIMGVILASLMYHLWQHRNTCRIDKVVMTPVWLVRNVKHDVRARLQLLDLKCISRSVLDWVKKL
ncbi:uncharacterized protein LOC141629297 [Silene latifolia]|uniref:uncharacterized protein LOC141629297 n=1 Tax=Silene latifolia TaxID=37657 RepID=UPI003D78326A